MDEKLLIGIFIVIILNLLVSVICLWFLCSFKDRQVKKLKDNLRQELEIENLVKEIQNGNEHAIPKFFSEKFGFLSNDLKLEKSLNKIIKIKNDDDDGTNF